MLALFLDDDRDALQMFSRAATLLGHQVLATSDPEEALAWVTEHRPQVVFVDYMMPRMDGLTFVRALRRLPEGFQARVYLLTASEAATMLPEALAAGADGLLPKPLSLDRLAEVLHD